MKDEPRMPSPGRSLRPRRSGFRTALCFALLLASVLAGTSVSFSPSAIAAQPDFAGPDFAAIDAYVQSQVDQAGIPGLALGIVWGDKVAHLQGFGHADPFGRAVTPQTPFIIGSVSKQFTALAIRQLINAGKVELDAPVQRYIPWFRLADAEASSRITVRQMLDHASGIPTSAGWESYQLDEQYTLEQLVRRFDTVHLDRPIGESAEYSNINYITLGLVVQIVSGLPYEQYVQQNIFAPLEMRHSYTSEQEAVSNGLATGYQTWFGLRVPRRGPFIKAQLSDGYLISTAEDMAHFMIPYLNNGYYGSTPVAAPPGSTPPQSGVAAIPGVHSSYDLRWYPRTGAPYYLMGQSGASTNFNSMLLPAPGPEEQWSVIVLANSRTVIDDFVPTITAYSIAMGVLKMLWGRQPDPVSGPSIAQWYLLIDGITLLLLAFTVAQTIRLRNWRRSMEHPGGETLPGVLLGVVLPILMDCILGLAILLVPPLVVSLSWPYLFIAMPDFSPIYAAVGFVLVAIGVAKVIIALQVRAAAKAVERPAGGAPLLPASPARHA